MEKKKPPVIEPEDSVELLTPKETAKILRTSVGGLAVRRSLKRIDLPYIKVGKSVFYDRADVMRFIESHKVRRTAPASIAIR